MLAIRAKICAVVRAGVTGIAGPAGSSGTAFRGFCGQRNASHDYNTGDRIVVLDRPAPTGVSSGPPPGPGAGASAPWSALRWREPTSAARIPEIPAAAASTSCPMDDQRALGKCPIP